MKLSEAMAFEQDWCERKSGEGGFPSDIWMTISAFANTEGGKIFIGIDNTGNVVGLNQAQIDQYQGDVVSLCRNTHFNQKIWPRVSVLEDAPVICVEISPLPHNQRPLYKEAVSLPRGAYVRIGSSNIKCDDEKLRSFYRNAAHGTAENSTIDSLRITDLDSQKITNYRNIVEARNPLALSQVPNDRMLLNIGATKSDGTVTLLGLLFFGNEESIRRYAPNCKVVFTHYRGIEKVDRDTGRVNQLDDKEFSGSIETQFTKVFEYLRGKLPVGAHLTGRIRIRHDEMSVPQDAIREVLANALVHRDYGSTGSPILIEMYDDRIDFKNPGQSLVAIAELATHQPVSRNPQIMNMMRDFGIAEQRGRGIPTIIRVMENADLPPPKFESSGDSFAACLTSANFLSTEIIAWLDRSFSSFELTVNQTRFLAWLKANGNSWLGNSDYRVINHLGTNQSLASREIKKMVGQSILISNGNRRRSRAYKIAPQFA